MLPIGIVVFPGSGIFDNLADNHCPSGALIGGGASIELGVRSQLDRECLPLRKRHREAGDKALYVARQTAVLGITIGQCACMREVGLTCW